MSKRVVCGVVGVSPVAVTRVRAAAGERYYRCGRSALMNLPHPLQTNGVRFHRAGCFVSSFSLVGAPFMRATSLAAREPAIFCLVFFYFFLKLISNQRV